MAASSAEGAARGAVLFWIAFQAVVVHTAFHKDNYMTRSLAAGHPTPAVVLILSCATADLMYFLMFRSNPGQVDPREFPLDGLSKEEMDAAFQAKRACAFCLCYRPLRAKHCHDCGRCIRKFDHHCFWVGTCVGERNHCLFWWFLVAATLMLAMACSVLYSSVDVTVQRPVGANVTLNAAAGPCLVVCGGLLVFSVSLVAGHSWLAVTGQTTWEFSRRSAIPYLRGLPHDFLPFDEGLGRNLRYFCCLSTKLYPRPWSVADTAAERSRTASTCISNEYYSCC